MTEDTQYFKMLNRMVKAGAKRAGNGDEIELGEFAEVLKSFQEQMENAVHAQLENGKSWTDIGLALGLSRQGAFRKFKR